MANIMPGQLWYVIALLSVHMVSEARNARLGASSRKAAQTVRPKPAVED
jgi:hypothetical protein